MFEDEFQNFNGVISFCWFNSGENHCLGIYEAAIMKFIWDYF